MKSEFGECKFLVNVIELLDSGKVRSWSLLWLILSPGSDSHEWGS